MRTWLTIDGTYVSDQPEVFVIGITVNGEYITNKTSSCYIRRVYRDGTYGAWSKISRHNLHKRATWDWAWFCAILSKWDIESKLYR